MMKGSYYRQGEKFGGFREYFNFWSKFLSFKGVSPWNEWRSRKKIEFSSFIVRWREVLTKHSHYRHWDKFWVFMYYFNFWSKFLSFEGVSPCNEWSRKKFEFSSFIVWWREVLTKPSHYRHWDKFWMFMDYFNFWSKFLSFKGVSPWNEWRSRKQIEFSSFIVWWREVLTKHSHYRHWEKVWVLMEYFNFWSKFLSFKGVSQWNEWRSRKKIEFSSFIVWWRDLTIHGAKFGVFMEYFNCW